MTVCAPNSTTRVLASDTPPAPHIARASQVQGLQRSQGLKSYLPSTNNTVINVFGVCWDRAKIGYICIHVYIPYPYHMYTLS